MFKLLGFGAAFGAAFQAWRNTPPDGPVSSDMMALVLGVAVVFAYLGGKWSGRGAHAYASASAHAEAHATAAAQNITQVYIGNGGAGASPVGIQVPGEDARWLDGSREMLELDQLDGMEVSELLEYSDSETESA